MSKTPECIVKDKIESFLSKESVLFFRRDAVGSNYRAGLPDIFFILNGVHCEVEVKAPQGKVSPLQLKWLDRFRSQNIPAIVVDSFEQFLNFYDLIKGIPPTPLPDYRSTSLF